MTRNRERDSRGEIPPLTPEETARYCGGGKRYGPAWLAEQQVGEKNKEGDLFPRKVIGVDSKGSPVYALEQKEPPPPHTFLGPQGQKRRQPPSARK